MGWTVYNRSMTEQEALLEMRSLHDWQSGDGTSYRVLADGITGAGENRGYYAAVQVEEPGKPTRVFAAVCLVTLCPFGRKEMSESMGPRIDNAPKYVLQALTPLPARDPKPCGTCHGTGKLKHHGNCYMCDGTGEYDRHDGAREWRQRAWKRHGGEPQGVQIAMEFAA